MNTIKKVYKRKPKISLTLHQEGYVIANHRRMVVKEMANNLKIPEMRVYSFIRRKRLDFKKTKPATKIINRKFGDGMFNPYDHKNWIA